MSAETDGRWKEHLAFTSAYILVFGLTLIKLWPAVAHFQIGLHIHFWNMYWPLLVARTQFLFYRELADLLAIGASICALALLHISCRGVWLAIPSQAKRQAAVLDRVCRTTFTASFVLIAIGVLTLLLSPISYVITPLLNEFFLLFLPTRFAQLMSTVVVLIAFYLFYYRIVLGWLPKFHDGVLGRLLPEFFEFNTFYVLICVVFFLLGLVAVESCYTAEVEINKEVFHRDPTEGVEIRVILGGATSAVNEANLRLLNSDGTTLMNDLSLQDVGGGRYLSYLSSRELREGSYSVRFRYPHLYLSPSFPFLSREIIKRRYFVITPDEPTSRTR